ncbi:hypothetical protein J802_4589 [Acinetobacter baumannii 45002_9]|nr:hypothetical protein J802_4589 [Acinetobacter baumannii 45002_9]
MRKPSERWETKRRTKYSLSQPYQNYFAHYVMNGLSRSIFS